MEQFRSISVAMFDKTVGTPRTVAQHVLVQMPALDKLYKRDKKSEPQLNDLAKRWTILSVDTMDSSTIGIMCNALLRSKASPQRSTLRIMSNASIRC